MTKIVYVEKNFRQPAIEVIEAANNIIGEYEAQGLVLTLRQRSSFTTSLFLVTTYPTLSRATRNWVVSSTMHAWLV
jgi:hypothetical protein